MKKSIISLIILCALFTACDQEPLFRYIAEEIPPIEPLIKGSPSAIVALESETPDRPVLYVSNGDIWTWDTKTYEEPAWHKMSPQPGGKIRTLATAGSFLFSLDREGKLKRWDGNTWVSVSVITGMPERIYGAGAYLFIGSQTGTPGSPSGYCILAMEASNITNITNIKSDTSLLSGAAEKGGSYYLGTMGNGIYVSSDLLGTLTPASNVPATAIITGLINHDGIIVAVTSNRQLFYSSGSDFSPTNQFSQNFSGAMASWKNNEGEKLLLLGLYRSSGSFGYGYREINDIASNSSPVIPGADSPSSVKPDYQYTSGISNHVVVALYVLPSSFPTTSDEGDRPIVYASTLKDGLWSYRTRRGAAQWNGEDNSN
jgi:hypothetical protein